MHQQSSTSMNLPFESLDPRFSGGTSEDLFAIFPPLVMTTEEDVPTVGAPAAISTAISYHAPNPLSLEDHVLQPASAEELFLADLHIQYQQLVMRYDNCLSQLRDTVEEAEILRRQNAELRLAYDALMKRLNSLTAGKQIGVQSQDPSVAASIINDFCRLCVSNPAPLPLSDIGNIENMLVPFPDCRHFREQELLVQKPPRLPLPKSISIRSSGYSTMNPGIGNSCDASSSSSAHTTSGPGRARSPVAVGSVLVGGEGNGCREEGEEATAGAGGVEVEVYGQGSFKTELCNKWEECGDCPYGENCQFAHGVTELRPVIRHPRYKTEVCRIVLSGDVCPYGHRCHFRHAVNTNNRLHTS